MSRPQSQSASDSSSPETDIYWAATQTHTTSPAIPTSHHNATVPVIFTPDSSAAVPTPTSSVAGSTSGDRQRFPGAAVPGVAAGASVLVVVLALLAMFLVIRRRRRKRVLHNRDLLRSSITVCFPPSNGDREGKDNGPEKKPEKYQLRDLENSFPITPRGTRITPRRSNSMPIVGEGVGVGMGGLDHPAFRDAPSVHHMPISRMPQGDGHRGSRAPPQVNLLPSPSLPGARYPPPQYPPPETPTVPSRVCSLQSQTRPATCVRRPSTRSSKSHTLVRSQSRSSVASSAGVGGPMVTFIPGAGRHSLPDGIIPGPAMALIPRTSASNPIGHHGKVIVGTASNVEPLAPAPSFQDIEEECPDVYAKQSLARNSDGGVTLPRTYSPYPRPASAQSKVWSSTTPAPLENKKARPRDTTSRNTSPLPLDYNKARSINARSISPPPLEYSKSRSIDARSTSPQQPPSSGQEDRPVLERLSWDDDPMPLGLHIRRGSSAPVQPVPASRLPVLSVAKRTSLREQSSQTFHSICSRAGSSAALIEDAAREGETAGDDGGMFSRALPGGWWRGAL